MKIEPTSGNVRRSGGDNEVVWGGDFQNSIPGTRVTGAFSPFQLKDCLDGSESFGTAERFVPMPLKQTPHDWARRVAISLDDHVYADSDHPIMGD